MFPEVAALCNANLEEQFELINQGVRETLNEPDKANHLYYLLDGGEYISQAKVNKALRIIQDVIQKGKCTEYLTDDEIICKGDKVDAIQAYRRKHNCSSIVEAKQAVERLRENGKEW